MFKTLLSFTSILAIACIISCSKKDETTPAANSGTSSTSSTSSTNSTGTTSSPSAFGYLNFKAKTTDFTSSFHNRLEIAGFGHWYYVVAKNETTKCW